MGFCVVVVFQWSKGTKVNEVSLKGTRVRGGGHCDALYYNPRAGTNAADADFWGTGIGYTLLPSLFLPVGHVPPPPGGTWVFGEVGAETVGFLDRYGSDLTISSRPVINLMERSYLIFESRLTFKRNKFRKSIITILTPVDPVNIENREMRDIRMTTAASGSGENAIRRL